MYNNNSYHFLPNISLKSNFTVFHHCINSKMNWIFAFPTVILMNQNRMFCNILTGGIPAVPIGDNKAKAPLNGIQFLVKDIKIKVILNNDYTRVSQ